MTLPEERDAPGEEARYLAVWNATVVGLEPGADYRAKRRRVLGCTFDGPADAAERRIQQHR